MADQTFPRNSKWLREQISSSLNFQSVMVKRPKLRHCDRTRILKPAADSPTCQTPVCHGFLFENGILCDFTDGRNSKCLERDKSAFLSFVFEFQFRLLKHNQ